MLTINDKTFPLQQMLKAITRREQLKVGSAALTAVKIVISQY